VRYLLQFIISKPHFTHRCYSKWEHKLQNCIIELWN